MAGASRSFSISDYLCWHTLLSDACFSFIWSSSESRAVFEGAKWLATLMAPTAYVLMAKISTKPSRLKARQLLDIEAVVSLTEGLPLRPPRLNISNPSRGTSAFCFIFGTNGLLQVRSAWLNYEVHYGFRGLLKPRYLGYAEREGPSNSYWRNNVVSILLETMNPVSVSVAASIVSAI